MRSISVNKTVGGAADTSEIFVAVTEFRAKKLQIEIAARIDRDCIVGEDRGIYRRELEESIREALDAYFRTA